MRDSYFRSLEISTTISFQNTSQSENNFFWRGRTLIGAQKKHLYSEVKEIVKTQAQFIASFFETTFTAPCKSTAPNPPTNLSDVPACRKQRIFVGYSRGCRTQVAKTSDKAPNRATLRHEPSSRQRRCGNNTGAETGAPTTGQLPSQPAVRDHVTRGGGGKAVVKFRTYEINTTLQNQKNNQLGSY
ncbi:hypothetical protein CDAR_438411 [Caerostris darwini]|uniref:Uncharacterized protein n=1 Tax=Caerostris darwini TaxID=1538125 RepID=A0AAV4X4P7_9ARAC|nr:hypothetical protein CDAR_438411 [Caerostris darwini]